MPQLPSVTSKKVPARAAMQESFRIHEEYERRRQAEEARRREAYMQEVKGLQAAEPFEKPKKDVPGKDWKERSRNIFDGMVSAAMGMEAGVPAQGEARESKEGQGTTGRGQGRQASYQKGDKVRFSGMRDQYGQEVKGEFTSDGNGGAYREWDATLDGSQRHYDAQGREKGSGGFTEPEGPIPQGDAMGADAAPGVIYASGPNEYAKVREGLGSSTYMGRPLKGVRLAVRGAAEVPGKGWNLELCQACDMEAPGAPFSADPYLTNKPYKLKNGKSGISRRQFYTPEDYGAMKAVANREGDAMVFYGDLLPVKGRDGSISFMVDTKTLKPSEVPFDLKKHGENAGKARVEASMRQGTELDAAMDAGEYTAPGKQAGEREDAPEKGAPAMPRQAQGKAGAAGVREGATNPELAGVTKPAPMAPVIPKPEGLLDEGPMMVNGIPAPGPLLDEPASVNGVQPPGDLLEEDNAPAWDLRLKPKGERSKPMGPEEFLDGLDAVEPVDLSGLGMEL